MPPSAHFLIFMLVSLATFAWLIRFTLKRRELGPPLRLLLVVSAVVVVGGMAFAKWGTMAGLPWWIYYGLPALQTLALPPVVFRMTRHEVPVYLVLAFLSSPLIHTVFSFFFGWKEYMPFIPIPSLMELLP